MAMAMTDRILLVEGESDRSFFVEVCKNLGLQTSVIVAAPKNVGGSHNTKEGVFNHLPTQLKQLGDASITHLAIVVDADSENNGGGYKHVIDRVFLEYIKIYLIYYEKQIKEETLAEDEAAYIPKGPYWAIKGLTLIIEL